MSGRSASTRLNTLSKFSTCLIRTSPRFVNTGWQHSEMLPQSAGLLHASTACHS